MKVGKSLARMVPGGLFAGYFAKSCWRHGVIDALETRHFRRQHPEGPDVEAKSHALDRDGYVRIDDHFDAVTTTALIHESRVFAERVAQGGIDSADLQVGLGGSFRVRWKPSYGEMVEQRFFNHPWLLSVARFYLGGPVKMNYKIFQRSLPGEDEEFFGLDEHFHFDYECRTFKAFLYLTDVTLDNGPLVYCPGTSRLSVNKLSKIARMHMQGTNRDLYNSSLEAHRLHLNERAVPLTGPAGTLLLADTRGYHKAGKVTHGLRDVLVLYYDRA